MRLRRVSFRGLTVFRQPTVLDLDAGGRLLALVGRNGEGKTTAMEAVIGALYGAFPSRPGSIYDWCKGRDGYIEAVFTDGAAHDYTARVNIDAEKRVMERYLFGNGGVPLTTGRAKEFEEAVARIFGTYDLLMASAFAAQSKNGSFLLLPKVQRKALFAELLGLGRLERLGAAAHARRSRAEAGLAAAQAAVAEAEHAVRDLGAAERRLVDADTLVLGAQERLEEARAAEGAAVQAHEAARASLGRLQARQEAFNTATEAAKDAKWAIERAEGRPDAARARAEQRRKEATARDLLAAGRKAHAEHGDRMLFLAQRESSLKRVVAGREEILAAAERLHGLEGDLQRLQVAAGDVIVADGTLARMQTQLEAAVQRRNDADRARAREVKALEGRAGLLAEVPCTVAPRWSAGGMEPKPKDLSGTCPLLADARGAKEKARALEADPALDVAVADAEAAVRDAQASWAQASLGADPVALEALKKELPNVRALAARSGEVARAERELDELGAERDRADAALQGFVALLEKETTERAATLADIETSLSEDLRAASSELAAARERLAATTEAARAAREALAGEELPDLAAMSLARNQAEGARRSAEEVYRCSDRERMAAYTELAAMLEVEASLEGLGETLNAAEGEALDWIFLDQAFGRDGIQALEIDAAGPEVAAISNDLLEAGGSAFRISFETQRAKKSKPGEFAESFDVRVYVGAEERLVEGLSGGEKVVVGEAIGLALAIYNSRKGGVKWRTLFRDETAGALDPQSAQAYVDMLRRALDLGGFDQAVFIAHQPEVYERADSRFYVSGGRISLEVA